MTDKFIDQDETQYYGPHASKNIRSRLLGRITEFDAALQYMADQIDTCTLAVKTAVDAARALDADRRMGTRTKGPLLKDATRLLGKFSKHLDTHDAGSIDRKGFFTKDGTAKGVGRSAHDLLLAITHISTKLADSKSPVRDGSFWHAQFDAMMKALAPAVAFANDAQSDRQSMTPEVEAARQAWLNVYTSAKCVVEGVLRLLGRIEQLPIVFYDLRVSPGTKVTAVPPDEAAAEREGDEDDQNDA